MSPPPSMSSSPSPAPLNLKRTASTSPDDSQKHKRRSSNPLPLLTPSPTDPACSTTLYIYSQMESEWKSACCIPLEELRDLSKRPAKWLRYIGWCLYGAPGTLHLSEDPASLEIPSNAGAVPDTDVEAPTLPTACYYISSHPPRYIDLQILADRTSAAESRKGKFRKRLLRRDRRCVFMQASHMHKYRMVRRADCDAAHIVPHSKGRQYIEILEDMHGVRPSDKLQGIDDPRNGLMLSHPLHRSAGKGECAFLLVPNPYMDVEDVHEGDFNLEPRDDSDDSDDSDSYYDEEEDEDDDYSGWDYGSDYLPSQTPSPLQTTRAMAEGEEEEARAGDGDDGDTGDAAADEEDATEDEGDKTPYLDPGMNDDSRMLLQWVGPYFDIIIQNSVRNNTQAVLRQSTRLFTLGIHHAYACAIINRWGRGLSDAPGGPEKSSPSKRKKAKRDAKEQKSPGFSSLQHSFLNPAIGASFYPGLNANHGRQNAGSSMDKVSSSTHARGPTRPRTSPPKPKKRSRMDEAWDLMLQWQLPPPHIAAEQEAASRIRMERVEKAGAAKAARWVANGLHAV